MSQLKAAYLLADLGEDSPEIERLTAQARRFVELELPLLTRWLKAPTKIFDFGCGTGVISQALAQHFPDCQVVGLDADRIAIKESRKRIGTLPNLEFIQWSILESAPVPGSPADLAFSRLLLLHLPDPAAAIRRMVESLAPQGRLYLVDTDDRDKIFEPREPWQDHLLETMEKVQRVRGSTRYLGRELKGMLEQAGLIEANSQRFYYSKQAIGIPSFMEIMLPGSKWYLDQANLTEAALHDMLEKVRKFLIREDTEVKICVWHATAVRG